MANGEKLAMRTTNVQVFRDAHVQLCDARVFGEWTRRCKVSMTRHGVVELLVRSQKRNNVRQIAVAKNTSQHNFVRYLFHFYLVFLWCRSSTDGNKFSLAFYLVFFWRFLVLVFGELL